MFVKKPKGCPQIHVINRFNDKKPKHHTAPTNLSSIRDPSTESVISYPTQVKRIIEQLETKALSSDARINPRDQFPWLNAIPNNPTARKNMVIGNLTPEIFQEALRSLPESY
jgi:hypothetical protein